MEGGASCGDEDGWDERRIGRDRSLSKGEDTARTRTVGAEGTASAGIIKIVFVCVRVRAKEDKEDQDGIPGLRGSSAKPV